MIINMNGAKAPEPSPVLQEKTVTPETLPVVIGTDEGYDGLSQVTVNPDAQLKAENIKGGAEIFGVEGEYGNNVKSFQIVTGMGSYGYNPGPVDGKYAVAWKLDFSESDKQYCTLKPDSANGIDLTVNNTNMYADRPPFLLPKYIPKNISWMGIDGTAPIHLNETKVIQSDYTLPLTIKTETKLLELTDGGMTMTDYFPVTYAHIRIPRPNNLTAENIKAGVTIAGVEGTYEALPSEVTLENAVTTAEAFPVVVTPSEGYDGLSRVTVHSPDNLSSGNIRSGVSIAGITGTYEGIGADDTPFRIMDAGPGRYYEVTVDSATFGGFTHLKQYALSYCTVSDTGWDLTSYIPDNYACSNIVQVTLKSGSAIPKGPIRIRNGAPYMFRYSRLINLPEGLAYLHDGMFDYCSFLENIEIPPGITRVTGFFNVCKFNLDGSAGSLEITIPETVTTIASGYHNLSGHSSSYKLNLVMKSATPPTLQGSNTLRDINRITVPVGCLEAYQTATNWSAWTSVMVEATE